MLNSVSDVSPSEPASRAISLAANSAELRNGLLAGSREHVEADGLIRLSFGNEAGRGELDFIEFNPEFNIIVSDCFWSWDGFLKYAGEGWIRFNFCLDATACFEFDDLGRYDLRGQELRVFYQPVGVDCGHHIQGGGRSVCVTLSVKRSYLTTIIGNAEARFPGLSSRDDTDGFFFHRSELGSASLRAVADLLTMRHRGTLRWLYAKAKAEELLVTALSGPQSSHDPTEQPRLRDSDRERISRVRHVLDRQFANPPSIPSLARRFGINRNKLSYGFREINDRSIGEYVAERRLETAWSLLQDTDLPVTQVAENVGYAHVQSFSAAFSRRYGFSPRALRRTFAAE